MVKIMKIFGLSLRMKTTNSLACAIALQNIIEVASFAASNATFGESRCRVGISKNANNTNAAR